MVGGAASWGECLLRVAGWAAGFWIRGYGEEVKLPDDEEAYEPAEPGFYELKNGSTCENPA